MWYETLSESVRQRLFAWMRRADADSQDALDRSRALDAPFGSVAVGAGAFDPFVRGESVREFLTCLRKGSTPKEALTQAKAYAHECVRLHNAKRPKDINWARSKQTADAHLDSRYRALVLVLKSD